MIKAINIKWDTEGENGEIHEVDLPSEVVIPDIFIEKECEACEKEKINWSECDSNSQSVNNYLSDTYGWCIQDYQLIEE